MAFHAMTRKTQGQKKLRARRAVMASILSAGLLGSVAAQAAGLGSGAWVSLEGLDNSATFVSFDAVEDAATGATAVPQDLTVLLAEVETVLGDEVAVPAVPASPAEVQILVSQAQALVAPILGAMGGGTLPNLAGLSLGDLPLNGFGAGGGGAPLALPGLDGLDAALPVDGLGGVLDGPLGGALDGGLGGGLGGGLPVGDAAGGVLGGVTGGLPTVPVVGGLLGQ